MIILQFDGRLMSWQQEQTTAISPADGLLIGYWQQMPVLARWCDQIVPDTADSADIRPYRQWIIDTHDERLPLLVRAGQMLLWQRDHQFCSRCGTPAHYDQGSELARVCPVCHYRQYPRISPVVIVAISRGDQILLAHHERARRQPGAPVYSLLAGFVEVGETLEQAVAREVHEESGLQIDQIRYMVSQPWPFPSNLMLGFTARYVSGDIVPQAGEIADARFFRYDRLPALPEQGTISRQLIDDFVRDCQNRSA